MKIVIDIPEETYEEVCTKENPYRWFYEDIALESIKNGTPLPKGQYDCRTIDRVLEIITRCGLHNAYERPSFWYNKGKGYKVIDTKYHRGYDQALADVEQAVKDLKGGEQG